MHCDNNKSLYDDHDITHNILIIITHCNKYNMRVRPMFGVLVSPEHLK